MRALEDELRRLVRAAPGLMAALHAARALELREWCIGAGAVRSVVWDALHGFAQPSALDDIDLVFFERPAVPDRERALETRLHAMLPGPRWEATNQATVHAWTGGPMLDSMEEGIATWPEVATCVGVRLEHDGQLTVIAPHGLDDLFALQVRHNPTLVSRETYHARLQAKRFSERWPQVTCHAAPDQARQYLL